MHIAIKTLAIAVALLLGFYAPDVIKELSKTQVIRPLDEYCMLSKQTCVQDSVAITLDKDKLQPMGFPVK